ncbi:MAG: serine/threonine protein kinase, partial [Gemmataceae bacterium]|nr:serine/threonine protein kinase [Gemmataceae bacterium]
MPGITHSGAIMGTPSYMPPEQARGERVGPAADQYALGALLYEALVGKPPFLGATPHETLVQVATLDPVPPSRLVPGVPRDLETITLKCLEKDQAKRYPSCQALADDLGCFLAGEAIQARPLGRWGRFAKWVRRYPAVAALASGLVVLASAALVVISLLYADAAQARDDARRERDDARRERNRAEALLYADQLASAQREAER